MTSGYNLPRPWFHAPHVTPWTLRPPIRTWLREIRRNMLTMIPAEAYETSIVSERLGPLRWHVLSSPDAFKHVFADKVAAYPKAPIMHRMLAPYLGQSLFMAEGADWKAQRQALAPAFRSAALGPMASAMHRVAEETVDRLAMSGVSGKTVPMSFEMRVLAMDMVRHTMFAGLAETVQSLQNVGNSAPNPDHLADYRSDLQGSLDQFLQRFGRPGLVELLDLPVWMTPWRYLKRPPTTAARELVDKLIAKRRASGGTHGDMLDILLDVRMPDQGRAMSDTEIRDNLLTFIVTGSDTTALALTWSIYILTQVPEWVGILRREADAAYADGLDLHSSEAMPLTRAFLDEVLRLFPSAPLLVRKARQRDRICGADIGQGDLIFAPIYTLHRHPKIWKDPHLFDPTRFLDHGVKRGHRYVPFGTGPKSCIGAGFAMMEAQIALATFVHRLDFKLQPGWDVKPLMMLTLKPDGGLPIIVSRRPGSVDASKPRRAPRQTTMRCDHAPDTEVV